MAFRPTVSGSLDEIVAGLTYCGPGGACTIPGATNVAILSLYAQTPLSPIGGDILLETITVSGQMQLWVGQGNALITALSTAHPYLDASQYYWLRVSVPDPQTGYLVWGQSLNSQGQDSNVSVSGGPYAFFSSTEAAIQINGTPAPEPASAVLAAIALSALLWGTRRGWASRPPSSSGLKRTRPHMGPRMRLYTEPASLKLLALGSAGSGSAPLTAHVRCGRRCGRTAQHTFRA